ncbi:MAG: hypothetical protein HOU81_23400 [Hamadaea sp.]|uniref:hypothetical protein n=1 Tax=Hamadaea sp. TaxID=2024425 RepID=UPI0017C5ADEC|nr:hypothetical protein [Hamadaea sp.]NUR73770.1 hypothetical protein [Hamadaea sp.]NUT18203.1 hypothetical protein [Hamadaea sp.]
MDAVSEARTLAQSGLGLEEILAHLRSHGVDFGDSMWVLAKAGILPPGAAKKAVFDSLTWADRRGRHVAFHEDVVRIADDLAALTGPSQQSGDQVPVISDVPRRFGDQVPVVSAKPGVER